MLIELLFWPCMIASLFLSILAIVFKKAKLLVFSSIFILPLSLYLAATPRFEGWGLLFPIFNMGAAISLYKNQMWLTILLVFPVFFLIGRIGVNVFWY